MVLVLTLLLSIPSWLWRAWVMKTIWFWYLSDVIETPSMKMFLGALMVMSASKAWISRSDWEAEKPEGRNVYRAGCILASFVLPAITLFMAWIVLKFI